MLGNQQICSFLCHTVQLSCTWTYTHFLRFLSINEKLHFCISLSTALISPVLVSRSVSYCKWYLVSAKHSNDKGCHVLCGRKVGKPGKLVCKHSASQNNQVSRNLCTNTIAVVEFTGVKKFHLLHFWKARHGVMKTAKNFTAWHFDPAISCNWKPRCSFVLIHLCGSLWRQTMHQTLGIWLLQNSDL